MPNIFKHRKRAEAAEAVRESEEVEPRGLVSTTATVYGVAHLSQQVSSPVNKSDHKDTIAQLSSLPPEETKSSCWRIAEDIFRRKVKEGRRSVDDAVITDFLKSQGSTLEKTIDICDSFKKKAESEYHRSDGKSNLVGKLLKTLTAVKEIGDPFLQFAPESVSIAWWAVTSVVQVAMKDMEKCELVAGASESLVTIILNCRLFEKRYGTRASGGGDMDTEKRILDKIPEVIAGVLNFAWYTKREFFGEGQGKLERIFKSSFSSTLKGLIDGILDDYKKLRVDTGDAFENRVMDQLESIYKGAEKNIENMKELLFPELNDIKTLMQDVIDAERRKVEAEEAQDAFKMRREAFNPNNQHKKQLEAILSPFKEDFDHKEMSRWFFEGQMYQAWESPESEDGPTLICVSAGRGFGKSVMMTCALKRLQELQVRANENKPVVLYFYFKKGDTATESMVKGMESIVSQLLDDRVYIREVNVKKAVNKIIDSATTAKATGDPGSSNNESAHTEQKKKGSDAPTERPKPINNIIMLKTIIEKVGKELDRPIYLVIDAVDECEPNSTADSDLMKLLKELTTSKVATIKAIISTREELEDSDFEPTVEGFDGAGNCLAVVHVDEEVNSQDMERYLKKELTKLMKRRLKNRSEEALDKERSRIVEIIKTKAKGSFTYAGMVLASIEQPYRSTLHQMLQNLPEGMDALYRKILQALTFEERSLVTLALVRTVWSFGEVTAIEVAEEFKRVYDGDFEAPSAYEPTDDGVVDVGDEPAEEEAYDPSNDPEIEDVIYHLRNAGREFLKVTKDTNIITIDSSVREWVLHEAAEAAIWQKENRPMTDFFTMDDDGNWKLSLPIPPAVGRGKGAALDFQSERDAQLDICIDIFKCLNHQLFQDRYMPYDIPWPEAEEENKEEAGEEVEQDGEGEEHEEGEDQDDEEDTVEPDAKADVGDCEEVEENKENAEEAAQAAEKAQTEVEMATDPAAELLVSRTDNEETGQNSAQQSTSLTMANGLLVLDSDDLIIATNLGEMDDGLKTARVTDATEKPELANEHSKSQSVQGAFDESGKTNGEHEQPPAVEDTEITDEATNKEHENGDDAPEPGNNDQPEGGEGEEAQEGEGEAAAEEETAAEGGQGEESGASFVARRYEAVYWLEHLKRLEELWEPSQRTGRKWAILWENIKEFVTSVSFAKWRFQYNHCTQMSLEEAIDRETSGRASQPLHNISQTGILMVVEKMVDEWGADIDAPSRTGQNPIQWSVRWPQLVKFYIDHNANVNCVSDDQWTPLMMCLSDMRDSWYARDKPSDEAALPDFDINAKALIAAGADITAQDVDNWVPLSYAVEIKNEPIFDILIEHENMSEEIVQHVSNDNKTPLHLLFLNPDRPEVAYRMAKILIEKGADVNAQDAYSTAPLARACEAGNIEAVKLLIEHKADILDDDEWGYTALHVSVVDEKDWAAPIGRVLLEAGADYGKKSAENATPLTSAVSGGNLESVELILEWCRKGPWIAPILTPQESEAGDTHEESKETERTVPDHVEGLISGDLNTEKTTEASKTGATSDQGVETSSGTVELNAPPTEQTETTQHTESTEKTPSTDTTEAPAIANETTGQSTEPVEGQAEAATEPPKPYHYVADNIWRGQNLLHICGWRGEIGLPMAKVLLAECTEEQIASLINAQQTDDGDDGRTPLYVAAQYYNKDLMAFFIDKGARVHEKSLNGETAVDVITRLWMQEEDIGMDETEIDKTQAEIYEGCLMVLLAHVDNTDEDQKLLHTATARGSEKILKILANNGIKPDVIDEHGWNTFHFAKSYETEKKLDELFPDFGRESLMSIQTLAPSKMSGNKHENLHVSEDGLTVWAEGDLASEAYLIRADHPVNVDGTHGYFEVFIESASKQFPSVGVGLVSSQQATDRMPGWRNYPFAQSFGFHGDDGNCFESANSGRAYDPTHPNADTRYDIGHTIGCGYDVVTNEVFYTHNGDYLGPAFTNVRGRLFPAVGMMCEAKVKVNFGDSGEFVYKGGKLGEGRRREMIRRVSEGGGRIPGSPRRIKSFPMQSIDDVVAQ